MTPEEEALAKLEQEQAELERKREEANNEDNSSEEERVKKLVQAGIDEELKKIKSKLDAAYKVRDEALAKAEALEAAKKEAELARLKEEGKFKEAFEMELAEEKAKRLALERKNIELTRDLELKSQLSSLEFRNENAIKMAYREIVEQLVQNEQEVWVHRSGVSIADFVKTFAADEANSFLFKQKLSSGGGGAPPKGTPKPNENGSVFSLSQAEVLKRAAANVASR